MLLVGEEVFTLTTSTVCRGEVGAINHVDHLTDLTSGLTDATPVRDFHSPVAAAAAAGAGNNRRDSNSQIGASPLSCGRWAITTNRLLYRVTGGNLMF